MENIDLCDVKFHLVCFVIATQKFSYTERTIQILVCKMRWVYGFPVLHMPTKHVYWVHIRSLCYDLCMMNIMRNKWLTANKQVLKFSKEQVTT